VDEQLSNFFAHLDNGHATLIPMHWSAVNASPDSHVEHRMIGKMHGATVCYWVPSKEAA
jgi:hypothetical protein